MRWRRKRVDLAERLRPYVDPGPVPEPIVDVDRIRMFLVRWMIETGDPIEVVAKGLDLVVGSLGVFMDRSVRRVPVREATVVANRLGLDSTCGSG